MSTFNDNSYTPPGAMPDHLIRYSTFRQFQVFEAIYRLGSFTRAAEELFLTQPTVSMQIKKLSEAIGLPLFEHVGRNVEPTEAGKELYVACRSMFETLANLEMKISDMKGLKRGRLRMGVITTAKYLAPEMLGEFSQIYPGIDLSLKVTNRDSIIRRIRANEDDLYIMGQAPEGDFEVESFSFAPNPLVVMAPRNHPLVGKKILVWKRSPENHSSFANQGREFVMPCLKRLMQQGCALLSVWNWVTMKLSNMLLLVAWACLSYHFIPCHSKELMAPLQF